MANVIHQLLRAARAMAFLALAHTTCVAAELDVTSLPSVTRHRGVFNAVAVDYTARVEVTVIADTGRSVARIVSTAYLRDATDAATRPVLFLFNGGPSSSSSMLHTVGLGPKRLLVAQDPGQPMPDPAKLVDNIETVLDVADLVFFDPVDAGWSRALGDTEVRTFFSTDGDGKLAARFVATWSKDHGRDASPKFVLGESYGTIRAALMAGELAATAPLDGVYLFGQAVNIVETTQRAKNALGYATNLPSLAAVAAYHGKIKMRGRSLSALIDEAYEWGLREYVPALIRGRDLDERTRRRVAQRLEEFSGISASYYLEHDLIIAKIEFARQLLADRGQIVAAYDARYAAAAPRAGERGTDPFAKVRAPILPLLKDHFAQTLRVTLPMNEYRDFAAIGGDEWRYVPTGGAGGPFWDYDYQSSLDKAFAANPKFRLVIGTGIYDLTTTVGPARYLVAQSHYPRDRVTLRQYEGGHMAYTSDAARKAFTDDIRAWLTYQTLPRGKP